MSLTNEERVDQLVEAQEKLREVIELLEDALKGTSEERYADAYLIGHLKARLGSDEYGGDDNIQRYIDKFIEAGNDDTEDHETGERI